MASQKKQCLKLGLGIQAGIYQEEGKAFQDLCAKAGQWDGALEKVSCLVGLNRVSPNVYMHQHHLEGLLKQIAGRHPQSL